MVAQTSKRSKKANSRRGSESRVFKKTLLLPAEHGSWSWLLVPFLAGVGVAGAWPLSTFLVLSGGLSAFLVRQPATAWLRIRQGRGRRSDRSLAAGWTLTFSSVSIISLAGLLLSGHTELLWLVPPILLILLLYLAIAQINRSQIRTLWMEVAGAGALAVMAPAAYVAGRDSLEPTAWVLWAVMATQNIVGVLYVRARIAHRHGREVNGTLLVAGHVVGFLLCTALVVFTAAPWPLLIPFGAFALRAAWVALRPRPLHNIKRFGFSEVGVEIISGLWIVASYQLWS